MSDTPWLADTLPEFNPVIDHHILPDLRISLSFRGENFALLCGVHKMGLKDLQLQPSDWLETWILNTTELDFQLNEQERLF